MPFLACAINLSISRSPDIPRFKVVILEIHSLGLMMLHAAVIGVTATTDGVIVGATATVVVVVVAAALAGGGGGRGGG